MRRGIDEARRGAALLIVLWMLLLMSLLAAAFVSTTHSDLAIARNEVESARARALADAGIARAVLAVGEADPARRWRGDGTPYRWSFGGGEIVVSMVVETGKIDLNAAPPEMLASLFRHAGADDGLSAQLAQEMLDRRAARRDAVRDPGGGATFDPTAPAFATIEDLGGLPGMTAPLLHAVLPLVTVDSRVPTVDPNTAPRDVLLSLPGADAAEIADFVAARAQLAAGEGVPPAPPASVQPYLGAAAVSAVTISSTAVTDTGGRFVREALVLLRARGAPYVVKRWSQALAN